jgi:hypothetical protein
MEPEDSLPHSQQPTTCAYPEPDRSSPCPTSHFSRFILILPSHLRLGLSSGSFPQVSPPNHLYAPLLGPIPATCPAHLKLHTSVEK